MTPYRGRELRGVVTSTWLAGEIIADSRNGRMVMR